MIRSWDAASPASSRRAARPRRRPARWPGAPGCQAAAAPARSNASWALAALPSPRHWRRAPRTRASLARTSDRATSGPVTPTGGAAGAAPSRRWRSRRPNSAPEFQLRGVLPRREPAIFHRRSYHRRSYHRATLRYQLRGRSTRGRSRRVVAAGPRALRLALLNPTPPAPGERRGSRIRRAALIRAKRVAAPRAPRGTGIPARCDPSPDTRPPRAGPAPPPPNR